MVAQAGQLSGWPVSVRAGISTPVWATTSERGNSGGSVTRYLTEVATMATTLTLSHPQFIFVFAALYRAGLRTIANDERTALRALVTKYILSLAARLPVAEVQI